MILVGRCVEGSERSRKGRWESRKYGEGHNGGKSEGWEEAKDGAIVNEEPFQSNIPWTLL